MIAHSCRVAISAICIACSGTLGRAEDKPADGSPFRVGMTVQDGTPAVQGLGVIRAGFERALGRPVEVIVARDYQTLVDAHTTGKIDYAVYSALAFAAATARCGCVRAIAAPTPSGGASGFSSILVSRPTTDPSNEARRIAVGPPDSVASHLVPVLLHPDIKDENSSVSLVRAETVGSAEALFLAGEVDAFFGWAIVSDNDPSRVEGGSLTRLAELSGAGDQFVVEWQSPPFPFGPHAVRADLDEMSVGRLLDLLTSGLDTEFTFTLDPLRGGGFTRVESADYAVYERLLSGN